MNFDLVFLFLQLYLAKNFFSDERRTMVEFIKDGIYYIHLIQAYFYWSLDKMIQYKLFFQLEC